MDSVEIIVFVGIAVIVGGLFIGFLADWDVNETYESLKSLFSSKEQSTEFEKVDKVGFISKLYASWEDCGLGEVNNTYTFYVKEGLPKDDNTLTKEFIFSELKKINYCNTLQSFEYDCGQREDVDMEDITLPAVVSIECIDGGLRVS